MSVAGGGDGGARRRDWPRADLPRLRAEVPCQCPDTAWLCEDRGVSVFGPKPGTAGDDAGSAISTCGSAT